jgi:THO complex subunit 3
LISPRAGINFDPKGKYFATGSADTLTSLWSATELICFRTLGRSEYPIRNLSFSFDGQLIAVASEDEYLNITHVESGDVVYVVYRIMWVVWVWMRMWV